MRLTPKNWGSFQQYKDRTPPWIKLHRQLLDDYDFACLPVASKALAPMLWLLASEYEDGVIDASLEKLAFRLRMTVGDLNDAINPLVEAKFFESDRDASEPLADCKQDACLETEVETEERKRQRATSASDDRFEEFWKAYPRTPVMSKKEALVAWKKLSENDRSAALSAVAPFKAWLAKQKDHPVVHACRFLSQRRFDGFAGEQKTIDIPVIPEELAVKLYKQTGRWHRDYGPEPGQIGCRAPCGILEQYGFHTPHETGEAA